jgi:hypothetical protein
MNPAYTQNLIKGKITEVIFEEMFRESGEFTVIPIGYEHTIPELAQYQHHVHIQKVLENIRSAPDFALISQDKAKVFLVEVKYRAEPTEKDLLEIATELFDKWNPCFLFIATKETFYFDSCKQIIDNKGTITSLSESWIKNTIQKEYLQVLKEFIRA